MRQKTKCDTKTVSPAKNVIIVAIAAAIAVTIVSAGISASGAEGKAATTVQTIAESSGFVTNAEAATKAKVKSFNVKKAKKKFSTNSYKYTMTAKWKKAKKASYYTVSYYYADKISWSLSGNFTLIKAFTVKTTSKTHVITLSGSDITNLKKDGYNGFAVIVRAYDSNGNLISTSGKYRKKL